MAKAKRKAKKVAKKKLGNWKLRRRGDVQVLLTLPKGMKVTGPSVTMADLMKAIATYKKIRKGQVVIKCCHGNMAIA